MYGKYKYGSNIFASYGSEDETPFDCNVDLMKYLPWFYVEINTSVNIQKAIEPEICSIKKDLEELQKQFYVETATWGLAAFEQELGIDSNPSLSYEVRRSIIKAKKRSRGTTTKKMIEETAMSFSGGEVEVIEHNENYSFTVKFIGVLGIPKNMKAFIQMIDEIRPAHLNYDFEYTFTNCDMLINWGVTCQQLIDEQVTCTALKSYKGGA